MLKRHLALLLILFCLGTVRAADLRGDTIDILRHRLSLGLQNFTGKIMTGDAELTVRARMDNVRGIHLDLLKLTVDSVMVNGMKVSYAYNDSVIHVPIGPPLNNGDTASVRLFYRGRPLQLTGDFGGFYWTNTHAFNIGVSFLSVPHPYGRVWFPCFDNFEERSLYDFYITTRSDHKAFCNGTLQGVNSGVNTRTWHWKLEDEIPSYLASVAVSDYATVSDTVNGMKGIIPIQLAARAPDTTSLKSTFVHLKDAFHIQEKHWGPYEWERVGFCVVPYSSGAMEHATNVSIMNLYLTALRSEAEVTMAHELSHHWFGNLVTCQSAEEMWLNEGWAVYNEGLFLEQFYGDSVYKKYVRDNHEFVLRQAHVRDGAYLPVSGVPSSQTYGTTVYRKGGDMIHTLRYYMGDSLFFGCVRKFLSDFAFQTATTAQLRDYLSQCSGLALQNYFADWIYQPGFAHFSIDWKEVLPTTGSGISAKLVIRQRKHRNTNYYNGVPVRISYFDWMWNRIDEAVMVSGECTSHSTLLPFDPVYVALDFDEKLQDAITDEWRKIKTAGTYSFGVGKATMNVSTITDSALVRVEYHWVRPQPMQNKIAGLHLHDKHYWTVDGIFPESMKATLRFDYNGNDSSLDGTFLTNREDSLKLMYRPDPSAEWMLADSFSVVTGGSLTDKTGYMLVHGAKKGDYTFAIYHAARTDSTAAEAACLFTSVRNNLTPPVEFQLFPNPASESVIIHFPSNVFKRVMIYDPMGRCVLNQEIKAGEQQRELFFKDMASGTYLLTLTAVSGERFSKIFLKQ